MHLKSQLVKILPCCFFHIIINTTKGFQAWYKAFIEEHLNKFVVLTDASTPCPLRSAFFFQQKKLKKNAVAFVKTFLKYLQHNNKNISLFLYNQFFFISLKSLRMNKILNSGPTTKRESGTKTKYFTISQITIANKLKLIRMKWTWVMKYNTK